MRKIFLFALPCIMATTANAQFSGYFAPHNWTESTTGSASTAIVDTTQAPDSLFFYGPDDESGLEGNLTYSIIMPSAGTLSFGFEVSSNDTAAVSDPYEYFIWTHNSDTLSIITDTTIGVTNFGVDSGAVFTFSINTSLNKNGNIQAKIFDWTFTTAALPVTGSPIAGQVQNGMVTLTWTTYSETDNQGFEIQRSTDGKNFSTIGFVESQAEGGNSAAQLKYTFSDNEQSAGNIFYRYRQIDFNGDYLYSNIASVFLSANASATLTVYPNPVSSGMSTISLDNPTPGVVELYDLSGRLVMNTSISQVSGTIDISRVAPGNYLLRFSNDKSVSYTGRIVVQ